MIAASTDLAGQFGAGKQRHRRAGVIAQQLRPVRQTRGVLRHMGEDDAAVAHIVGVQLVLVDALLHHPQGFARVFQHAGLSSGVNATDRTRNDKLLPAGHHRPAARAGPRAERSRFQHDAGRAVVRQFQRAAQAGVAGPDDRDVHLIRQRLQRGVLGRRCLPPVGGVLEIPA